MDHASYNRTAALLRHAEYRPSKLARILGTREAFLFQEVWKGNLVASRIGNDIVRFSRDDVLRWLASRNSAQVQATEPDVSIGAA